jgi:hypothetical protein
VWIHANKLYIQTTIPGCFVHMVQGRKSQVIETFHTESSYQGKLADGGPAGLQGLHGCVSVWVDAVYNDQDNEQEKSQ